MKKIGLFLISGLLLSCSGTKSAYTTQQELEAYLGKSVEASFTQLTPEEQTSPVVVFDYQVKITGSKVAGIQLFDFLNSGQVNYWIHFRTNAISSDNKIILPAPLPSIESSVDLFLKVTTSEGITYYAKNELGKFLKVCRGTVISDLAGQSRFELNSVPPDWEVEYVMNQTLKSLPFSIGFQFIEQAGYRNLNIRVDTGNDFNQAYLATRNSFLLINENSSGNLIEKLVDKKNKTVDGIPNLGGNFSLRIDPSAFNPSEPAVFFLPLNRETIKISDLYQTAIFNLNRNTFYSIRSWSDFQRTGIVVKIKSGLNLPGDTDTKLKAESALSQKKAISDYIGKIRLEKLTTDGMIDPYFLSFDEAYSKNVLKLIWYTNLGNSFSGLLLEKKESDVTVHDMTIKSQADSESYAGYN